MAKLPYMPFFPADYLRDTRCLSLAARGAWMDILCALWNSPKRGRRTLTLEGWAGEIGKASSEVSLVLHELEASEIGNISRENDEKITIISRRMVRDERNRKLAAKRKQKQRDNSESRSESRDSHGDVTGIYQKSDIRSQISEVRELREERKEKSRTLGRAERLAMLEAFVVTDEMREWARREYGVEIPEHVVREFKDHWRNEKTLRTDWDATFRNRIAQLVGWKTLTPGKSAKGIASWEKDFVAEGVKA